MEPTRIIIAGGGIVGLATAYSILQQNGPFRVTVIEKEADIAQHQTGHNSGVIHSGIYYKPGSLKAINCVKGYQMLLSFCQENNIAYERCGKIIVATRKEELSTLETLFQRGVTNGLEGVKKLNKDELREYEPHVAGLAGLFVPQTGIVDFSAVARKLAEKITSQGGEILTGVRLTRLNQKGREVIVTGNDCDYRADIFVNCAGLYSDVLARQVFRHLNVRIIPFRGEYYKLRKESEHLVRNLIYPVPDPAFPFLGVHFTRMIGGGVEAGPNAVLAFRREGYRKADISFSELAGTLSWPGFVRVAIKYWRTGLEEMYRSYSKAAFTRALQRLVPEITEDDLVPGGSGVRAQACHRNGTLLDDFLILETERMVHVCNAPSPAATSSLSIGQHVAAKVLQKIQ
ncbi:MAG: hydroxyglutarate oxidase [Cyclobacteriaceae bacterium]|nr:MAG: hydroxyglutarate oxidase [Cyclobacteriaceae bacterium]